MEVTGMAKQYIKRKLMAKGHSHPELVAPLMAGRIEQRESITSLKRTLKEKLDWNRKQVIWYYVEENTVDQKVLKNRYSGDLKAVERDINRLYEEASRNIDSASSYDQMRTALKTLTKKVVHDIIGKRRSFGRGEKWDEFYENEAWEIEKAETEFEGIKYDW